MRILDIAIAVTSMLLGAGPALPADPEFQPGEWALTSKVELRGEHRAAQQWTETKCVTLEELRSGKLFIGKLDISGCALRLRGLYEKSPGQKPGLS